MISRDVPAVDCTAAGAKIDPESREIVRGAGLETRGHFDDPIGEV
jgi:hypothetical protein